MVGDILSGHIHTMPNAVTRAHIVCEMEIEAIHFRSQDLFVWSSWSLQYHRLDVRVCENMRHFRDRSIGRSVCAPEYLVLRAKLHYCCCCWRYTNRQRLVIHHRIRIITKKMCNDQDFIRLALCNSSAIRAEFGPHYHPVTNIPICILYIITNFNLK